MAINSNLYVLLLSRDYPIDDVVNHIDGNKKITHWFRTLPGSVFLKTTLNAKQISEYLDVKFDRKRHVVIRVGTKVREDYFGSLPKDMWEQFW